MNIFDFEQFDNDSPIETDLCIIGSGPAGLTIANEFIGTATRVLVLESGGLDDEHETDDLNDIESVGAPRRMEQRTVRRRILGGSSHTWTGRCAPFDALDFEKRPWIPYSGWPITLAELDPYLEKARAYLCLGPNCYDDTLWSRFNQREPLPRLDTALLEPIFWQFSKSPRDRQIAVDFGADFIHAKPANIQVLLHASVTHINIGADRSNADSVEISTLSGKRTTVSAKTFVLCGGGIENARLLLASNRQIATGIGNGNDLVGRFLMDHPQCVIWELNPEHAVRMLDRFGGYWLHDEKGKHTYLHGLALSRDIQCNEHLLHCHAFIDQAANAGDQWSALSRLSTNLRSRRFAKTTYDDLGVVFRHPGEVARGLFRRFVKRRPQILTADQNSFCLMLEQLPDPESRITLSEKHRDKLGIPLSNINWKIGDLERRTARRMGELVNHEFKRLNLPAPALPDWLDRYDAFVSRCSEKAHPTGTTRMADSANEGVVDRNCQVHGMNNLFLSGSSVFPTSGAANPTLMIVAMAVRLADWMKKHQFGHQSAEVMNVKPATLRDRFAAASQAKKDAVRTKVAFIGAGQRISQFYVPILRKMSDEFEIVGFTTRSAVGYRRFESQTGIAPFANAKELVEATKPAFLIVGVPAGHNEATIMQLLDLRVPLLTETPAAWTAAGVRRIIRKADANCVSVAVAEQTPFLPLEQFRARLMELDVFGDVYVACNDFHTGRYHGMAELRLYMKGRAKYVRNIENRFEERHNSLIDIQRKDLLWQSGHVTYDDGAVLLHNFGVLHNYGFPHLFYQTVFQIHGRKGAMAGYEITTLNEKTKQVETVVAKREESQEGHLKRIRVNLSNIGEVTWDNPVFEHAFSDEEIAVATLLKGMAAAVTEGRRVPYTLEDNLGDMEIMEALRYSSYRNGAVITLPLNEMVQKGLCVVNPEFWRYRKRRSGLA